MFRNSLQRGAAALAGGRLPRGAIALRGFASGGAAAERIVRFIADDGEEHFGAFTDPSEASCRVAERGPSGRLALGTVVKGVDTILPPVEPPVVYCIGLNYSDHAAEVKMLAPPEFPVVFSKAVTSLIGHKSAIVIPAIASSPPEVDYEAELGVVIGRECKDVSEAEALNYVRVRGCGGRVTGSAAKPQGAGARPRAVGGTRAMIDSHASPEQRSPSQFV